jgi:putative oxidoreductase
MSIPIETEPLARVRVSHQLAVWAPLVIRVVVGFGFMAHGLAKLTRGADVFAAVLAALHVPFPPEMAWATIVVELLGGAAVFAGIAVRLAAVPMAVVMIVAALRVHLAFGFSSIKLLSVTATGPVFGPPGYEVAVLYLAALVSLMLTGAGPFSGDALVRRLRQP